MNQLCDNDLCQIDGEDVPSIWRRYPQTTDVLRMFDFLQRKRFPGGHMPVRADSSHASAIGLRTPAKATPAPRTP
jgi:hypothetical protein